MPFLSKIPINPLRSGAQNLLRNPHKMKAAVYQGFAVLNETDRLLWRVDSPDPHRPFLLVLGPRRPDWSHLVEQAGRPGAEGGEPVTADYTPLLQRLRAGDEYAFRVTANPVQNTKSPQKPSPEQRERMKRAGENLRGQRVAHRTAAKQAEWFVGRSAKCGFEVPEARIEGPVIMGLGEEGESPLDLRVVDRITHRFSKKAADTDRGQKDRIQVTLSTATFEGRLRVVDADLLSTALCDGIGPAKGYGCGLLTLAPLVSSGTSRA